MGVTKILIMPFLSIYLLMPCPHSQKGQISGIGVCAKIGDKRIAYENGYSFIEESVQGFLIPDRSEDEFNAKLTGVKGSPVPVKVCNNFLPGSLKSVGVQAAHDKILGYAETAFRRAKLVGVGIIVFGSGGSRGIPDGFPREEAITQFISLCSRLAPVAARYGVTIALEPLNSKECNFINNLAEGAKIVKVVNHPNFRLLADIYHMNMEHESPNDILKYGDLIKHVHIAEKEGRAAPGTHGEDFRPYFEALKKIGYKGLLSIECRWENFNLQMPVAIDSLKGQLPGN